MTTEQPYHWWRVDALCAQTDADLFFIDRGESAGEAKRVCQMCPVRQQCLAESAVLGDEYGIWGGFGRNVRRQLHLRVLNGANPHAVAAAAIQKERDEQARTADHHRVPARGRDRAGLRALAG